MKNLLTLISVVSVLAILSCTKTQFDEYEISAGSADFSNYIAVGNSITQGYQDNGVHNDHGEQENSFPAVLARQMNLAGANLDFKQPLVTGHGSGYMFLKYEDEEIVPVSNSVYDITFGIPVIVTVGDPDARNYDASWLNWGNTAVKYNNLGVSGIRLVDCVPTEGDEYISGLINHFTNSANDYGRFLDWGTPDLPCVPLPPPFTCPSTSVSYLDHIKASNATFFTCWLGNNDILGWAVLGGDDSEIINIPGVGNIAPTALSDPFEFREKYDKVLDAFTTMGAEGVCATIPDITSIPYFNTVTLDRVGSDLWIVESDGFTVREATDEDLFLLTALGEIQKGKGLILLNPLPHNQVLDRDEVLLARNRTNELNNEIIASAAAHGFPIVDMYEYMGELESGLSFDGVDYSSIYIEGGAFSLDGIHPNQRGYSIVANKFIEVINMNYGSSLLPVVAGNQTGIIFP